MTVEEYTAWNQTWLATWKHPDLRKGYQELTYEPMIELVRFLQRNEFKVYVFTADEGAFVKLVTWGLYRIPPEQAQGSSIKLKYDGERVRARLIRTREAQYFDNWDAKPRLIHQTIGKRPIFAAGNSNGDLHMLQYTAKARGPSMSLLVHHTDGEREYAYDEHTDKVMPMAKSSGWVIVDMKNDWVTMFSPPF
jgi:hypothetical protein